MEPTKAATISHVDASFRICMCAWNFFDEKWDKQIFMGKRPKKTQPYNQISLKTSNENIQRYKSFVNKYQVFS